MGLSRDLVYFATQDNIARQHEERISLHQFNENSPPETPERIRLRQIFNKLDPDGQGYIPVEKVKEIIRRHQCPEMPAGACSTLLGIPSEFHEGRVDFEDFCRLSQEHKHMVQHYLSKFCHLLIPDPHRPAPHPRDRSFDKIEYRTYEENMKFWPPPLTMIAFSIVQVITFSIDVMHLKEDLGQLGSIGQSTRGPAASLFIYSPNRRLEIWRFFSYMFVHIGIWHLVANLVAQICLGFFLELVHCWWRVAIVYVAGVVAGSVGMSLATPNVFLAGASGGVYALITAHISTIIMNWREMRYAVVQLFVFLVYIASDAVSVALSQLTGQKDQTSHMTHFCGAIAGLLVGLGVLRNLQVETWERVLWWVAVTTFSLLMIAGICVHIILPSHFQLQV